MRSRFAFLPAIVVALIAASSVAHAQPDKDKDPLSWDRKISSIVQRHCIRCHNSEKASGEVNLARDADVRLILEHRDVWMTALTVVESSEMPPEDAKPLAAEDRELLISFLKQTLADLGCDSRKDPGKPIVRRLNRVEYDLAIEDLTGLALKTAERFAPDESGYGFDNIGEALSLSPVLVEQYHDAAKSIVAALKKCKETDRALFARSFGEVPRDDKHAIEVARESISRFATSAFRRPVEPGYVDSLMLIYAKARKAEYSHEDAMGQLLTAVFISPKFLLRLEKNQPHADSPYPVDDYELATRLSFFLWSRSPDAELLDLATQGKLQDEEVLEAQALRMLADRRSQALVDNFFGQWLSFRELKSHQPDPAHFKEFDELLRHAMAEEVKSLLTEIVQKDQPITHLLDADYTYLNDRLAQHYGIHGVEGSHVRRVQLTDRRRGGVLTSAALLMLQADPARTNVPRRGNFIAGRILGTPPPPPPPGVPPLEATANDGTPRSLRALLELHRSKPECANCHAKMDPLGFALENYDAIGRWRTEDNGFAIDPSGELPNGKSFNGPVELKNVLLENKEAFATTLIKNLLIYALGRGLSGSDECVVRDALANSQSHQDRFSSIVVEIVKSYPFRFRQNPVD